ncbi:hypothetical protein BT63DRAFT_423665 [Microthyrium microscopicum]|uniref:Uncharacterized protein n=1 Tax=Microthyrium microscopicum TaxID=703497 RepID=A0A6A6UGZ5_9PEZI|nr:hypothetical protein BT63DRAFT_423665 [Microthyrium microscopicum]
MPFKLFSAFQDLPDIVTPDIFLQFAFLGRHNNYLVGIAELHSNRHLSKPSDIYCHGLPEQFSKTIAKNSRYNFNVRGHDFLAHFGQWRGHTNSGYLDATSSMIEEIAELQSFVNASKSKANPGGEPAFLSFGPDPGSFFADNGETRYRWSNLPHDLDDAIQDIVCRERYGKIHDVAINGAGGWVIQLNKGKEYKWGGPLEERFRVALENGEQRRATITRLYLNHQNKEEYVLIFNDGKAYASLHEGFKTIFKSYVERAISKKVEWEYYDLCYCTEEEQELANAAYYNRRGLFQLHRGAFEKALCYLQEAVRLQNTARFRDDYGMALIAVREVRKDPKVERLLELAASQERPPGVLPWFVNDYLNIVGIDDDSYARLSALLQRSRILPQSWSWSDSVRIERDVGVYEMNPVHEGLPQGMTELDGSSVSRTECNKSSATRYA